MKNFFLKNIHFFLVTIIFAVPTLGKTVVINVDWAKTQPTETSYSFSDLDIAVRSALDNDEQIILEFTNNPKWMFIKTIPTITDVEVERAVPNLTLYSAFIQTVMKRYKGKIDYYLLWKRPTASNLLANNSQVYAMFSAGIKAIKAEGGKVLLPEPGNTNIVWINNYLKNPSYAQPDGIYLYPFDTQSVDDFGTKIYNLQTKILKDKKMNIFVDFIYLSETNEELFKQTLYALDFDDDGNAIIPGDRVKEVDITSPAITSELSKYDYSDIDDILSIDSELSGNEQGEKITPLKGFYGGEYYYLNSTTLGKLCATRPNLNVPERNNPFIYFDIPDKFMFFNTENQKIRIDLTFLGSMYSTLDGFNILYDSQSGIKSTNNWIWIDQGRNEKYTYSLVLDDASFASSYGYDFGINAGASPNSLYLVNVVVTKLNPDGTEILPPKKDETESVTIEENEQSVTEEITTNLKQEILLF